MYVCVCHAVTERDVRDAVTNGCESLRDLRERLSMGHSCGRCVSCARDMLKSCGQSRPIAASALPA